MTPKEAIKQLEDLQGYVFSETGHLPSDEDEMAISVLIEAFKKIQWIPCSERLPESYKLVVASIRAETGYIKKPYVWDVCKAYCCGDGSWETSLSGTRNLVVEAWMPLPEPYKEEEKE